MKFIADFHLHSKYSRATSREMDLEHMVEWAKKKGISLLGTGDFTHPLWFKEIKEKLEPFAEGIFKLKNKKSSTFFILTTEISCIYSKKGKLKKIHLIIFAPSFGVVEKINTHLSWLGNLKADGRPVLGLDAKELLKIVLDISPQIFVVPAHAWTPWFSVFGSKSGFDSLEECFEDLTKEIFAIETGLSSDPPMNWRLSCLDKITLISNSDSHSPQKIGREANVFDTDLNYSAIVEAIKKKDKERFLYTIEFFPEEGKYHYDGHRLCGLSFSPQETKKYQGICPRCKKPLTIGVLNRVEQLADRPEGFRPENAIPFKSLIPLQEIIAEVLRQGMMTMAVEKEYQKLLEAFENEFNVLLNVQRVDLEKITLPKIVEGILRVREGKVLIKAGYDGVYGKIKIFFEDSSEKPLKQGTLF